MVSFGGIETPAQQKQRYPLTPMPFGVDTPDPTGATPYRERTAAGIETPQPPTPLNTELVPVVVDDDDDDDMLPPSKSLSSTFHRVGKEEYESEASKKSSSNIKLLLRDNNGRDGTSKSSTMMRKVGFASDSSMGSHKGGLSLVSLGKAEHRISDPFECWAIVFGFDPEMLEDVQYRFSSYGTIVRQTSGLRAGNYICLKYRTRMQAEKACCQNGTFHKSGIIIGVRRMDAKIAGEIGLDINDDANDSLKFTGGKAFTVPKKMSPSSKDKHDTEQITERDLIKSPKINPTPPEKFINWLFNW